MNDLIKFGIGALSQLPVNYDYNSSVKKVLNDVGDTPVVEIQVFRTPLQGYVDLGLTGLTAGDWDRAVKKYGYDEVFHLYMICTLKTGQKVLVEKNEVINVAIALPAQYEQTNPHYVQPVPIRGARNITVKGLLRNTRLLVGKNKFFTYNFRTNNCQVFISDILTANSLETDELEKFIRQPIDKIASELKQDDLFLPSVLPNIAGLISSRF